MCFFIIYYKMIIGNWLPKNSMAQWLMPKMFNHAPIKYLCVYARAK